MFFNLVFLRIGEDDSGLGIIMWLKIYNLLVLFYEIISDVIEGIDVKLL